MSGLPTTSIAWAFLLACRSDPTPGERVALQPHTGTPVTEAFEAWGTALGGGIVRCEFPVGYEPAVYDLRTRRDGEGWITVVPTPSGVKAIDRAFRRGTTHVMSWSDARQGQTGQCEVKEVETTVVRGRVVPPANGRVHFRGCWGVKARGNSLEVSVPRGLSCEVEGSVYREGQVWKGTVELEENAPPFVLVLTLEEAGAERKAFIEELSRRPKPPYPLDVALEMPMRPEAKAILQETRRRRTMLDSMSEKILGELETDAR